MSEAVLDEMREQLEQKGAFDCFRKKKEDEERHGLMDIKLTQLKKSMDERDKEPFLEVEPVDHILSDAEAKALSMFFVKKEIDELINKKYSTIRTSSAMKSILIELSQLGVSPKKPHRFVSCLNCGIIKEFVVANYVGEFWEMQKKFYCDGCKIEIEKLNKEKHTQISLIQPVK